MKTHKDLDVWKTSMELTRAIYKFTENFPPSELYGLTSQIRRAAVSIASNIAEGAARQTKKEYVQFLYCALGSASEVETQLELSVMLEYAVREDVQPILDVQKRVSMMLSGVIRKWKRL